MSLAQLRDPARHDGGKIVIPPLMLAHAHEIDQSLAMVKQAKQLDDQDIAYDKTVEVGGMIEAGRGAGAADVCGA